jgi:hypothetical protein
MITFGWWVGLAILVLLTLGLVACVLDVFVAEEEMRVVGGILAFFVAVFLVVTVAAMWPVFDMDYHRWKPSGGTVTNVVPRQIATDGGMQTVFAVEIAGVGVRRCDDTRCALVVPGDSLWLRCKRSYEWGTPKSSHGYECLYVRWERRS